MEWSDTGIVLSLRAHGETSAIVEALTKTHGRHVGLVRGGASRKKRSELQPGNTLALHWRARLSEHLGNFTAEPLHSRAGDLLDSRDALAGLNAFTGMAAAALPEREHHGGLFEAGEILLDAMTNEPFEHWGPLYVRWEAGPSKRSASGSISRNAPRPACVRILCMSHPKAAVRSPRKRANLMRDGCSTCRNSCWDRKTRRSRARKSRPA